MSKNFKENPVKMAPVLPHVTVKFHPEKGNISVDYKALPDWDTAVDLLIDGLQIAKREANKQKAKKESPIIQPNRGLLVPS